MSALRPGVTAVIPAHPPRLPTHLPRALASVFRQTCPVQDVAIAVDHGREGAAATRNRALDAVQTQWTAFLDSDDTWDDDHLAHLMARAEETSADLVYPWFRVVNGLDPFPQYEGQPFNPQALRHVQNFIPVTVLVRTEAIRAVGGFREHAYDRSRFDASPCEDWNTWVRLLDAGAKIVHLNRRTWSWIWGDNTSGRPDRW